VRPRLLVVLGVAALGVAESVQGAGSAHVTATLEREHESARPGTAFWVGLRLRMAPGWHTYWKNPGDSGLPTRIAWTLPEGFRAGPIFWPQPERMPAGPVMSYGYAGEVLLLTEVTPPSSMTAGTEATLAARVSWLECREACLPGKADLRLSVSIRAEAPRLSSASSAFAATRRRLPEPGAAWTPRAAAEKDRFTLGFRPPAGARVKDAYFFAEEPEVVEYAAAQPLRARADGYEVGLRRATNGPRLPAGLRGVLVVWPDRGEPRALEIDAHF
jgi:thiol:disulfide interchange protein DsbD